ncbi:MAG: DUF1573 domain-containing protein [Salinivirgaceae bacterium]|jgi:hypothetical protein|nr:DUF1573 domain-containing protein [Salinivirgaceae bacterium]
MKKYFITLMMVAVGMLTTTAQQIGPSISWDEPTYNFGDIKEDGGKVTHKFSFTNTGSEPLVITNVRPSCGCTSSDYTKEPVAAGAKGYVSASFNPLRRIGKNSKSITVTTNGTPPTSTLRFTANVLAKPKTVEDDYPRTLGDLRLKTNHLALMKVTTNEVKEGEIEVINLKENNLSLEFRNVPAHISIKAVPETLKPQEKGKILVKYDASKKKDYGFLMDRISVAINGNTNKNANRISVSATIEEDFSKLTPEQRANAPKIVFDSKIFDFETIKQGESVDHVFALKNEGKSDLIIRKTKASCGCTVVSPSKEVIKPGESAELKVRFNSAGKRNKQNKSITVITNDPAESQVVLRVKGMVNDPDMENKK